MKVQRGFTLVELVVSIAVTLVLFTAVYGAVNSVQRSSSGIERRIEAQQAVKPILDLMALEIGMASYNPNHVPGIWVNPDTCFIAGQQEYRGIQEATPNSISLQMDISKDGRIGETNEIIRYQYLDDPSELRITRENIRCNPKPDPEEDPRTSSGARPLLGGNPGTGVPSTVRVVNGPLNIPLFRYYDGTGAEIDADSLPGAIPDIRRIDITLAVETQNVDLMRRERRQLIYSTSTIPRNHAIIP